MGKINIGLRGWRFDEADVLDEDGEWRPLEEMPEETRQRVLRLTKLVGEPCDACWLLHGDGDLEACNPAAVVYGEPLAEVLLCREHEADFLYWYREAGGEAYRGEDELQDAFHEWFADGGRAPAGYGGLEHVDTDPETVPTPAPPAAETFEPEDPAEIDLRDIDLDAEYPTG